MDASSCPGCRQGDEIIARLQQQLATLTERVRTLDEQLAKNASNSSLPPSANPPQAPKPVVKQPSGKRPGGQSGHPPTLQRRLPPERLQPIIGEFQVALETGGLRTSQALDFDQSPGTSVGRDPALVYNSDTVDVLPILNGVVPSDPTRGVPTQIVATLTWDAGTPNQVVQPGVSFATTGHAAGDTYLLGVQVQNAVTTSGPHPWQLNVQVSYASGNPVNYAAAGTTDVRKQMSPARGGPTHRGRCDLRA